jgi:NAD(P)-dependent dehydrogenase (short-subunit alcohol dehydrogenase family)
MPFLAPAGATHRPIAAAFDLTGRVAVITGGGGLLGRQHAAAIAELGGTPVLLDIDRDAADEAAAALRDCFDVPVRAWHTDICDAAAVGAAAGHIVREFGRVDILINNAANDSKAGPHGMIDDHARVEEFNLARWNRDIAVGLSGAFLCSQVIGAEMARRGSGVILNVASDLALIGPDQRLYARPELRQDEQPVKPVSYSVVKAGLLGLTRYLATYWAHCGIRVNAISPGGVRTDQDSEFVARLVQLVPLGRMARVDEYRAAVAFLVSDASSYMTGANLVVDGGRTAW